MKKTGNTLKAIIFFIAIAAIMSWLYLIRPQLIFDFLQWLTFFIIAVGLMFIGKKIHDGNGFFSRNASSDNSETNKIIHFESIRPKKMFYNQRETQAIATLSSLLTEDNYRKIVERLDNKGMRKGFACLFTGRSGTGKTETAYQIARETKRDIMIVDISQVRDSLYGASEKKIKEIFDSYHDLAEKSLTAPILLFNEADAVISKRKELSRHNRAIDQSENTMQNIILSEMENLNGILIATTNLFRNMDFAFERRFLYRIDFDKPSAENRKEIWKTLMPDLRDDLIQELSQEYELSGGQIENIARKTEVSRVLNDDVLPMDLLIQFCKEESQSSIDTSRQEAD